MVIKIWRLAAGEWYADFIDSLGAHFQFGPYESKARAIAALRADNVRMAPYLTILGL